MKHKMVLKHEFVEYIPNDLRDGTIYVSVAFATVAHKCCCGCGNEVVTPLSPTDWKLTFDGEAISLDPSIGNWSFRCRSHYWIERNRVKWAPRWSEKEIRAGRARDRWTKERYFDNAKAPTVGDTKASGGKSGEGRSEESLWRKLKNWWA
jgi:hypothetical protein